MVKDGTSDLDSHSNFRIPIGVLAGLMVSIAVFLYAQDERLHHFVDQRFHDFELRLDGKADKTQASDRYTGSQAAAVNQANQDTHAALRRELVEMRKSLQREIDHIHADLDAHKEYCKENHK